MKMRHDKLIVTLLALGGLMGLTAVTVFLFVPTFKDVVKLADDIGQAHAELDAQYADRKNLLSSLTKAETARADVQRLAAQFVPAGRELDLITAVENLAAKDGAVERMTLSANEGNKGADELRENYDLTVDGAYRNVMQMLVDLEKMPTLLIADTVTVRPGTDADPSFLSVQMHGRLASPPKGL